MTNQSISQDTYELYGRPQENRLQDQWTSRKKAICCTPKKKKKTNSKAVCLIICSMQRKSKNRVQFVRKIPEITFIFPSYNKSSSDKLIPICLYITF